MKRVQIGQALVVALVGCVLAAGASRATAQVEVDPGIDAGARGQLQGDVQAPGAAAQTETDAQIRAGQQPAAQQPGQQQPGQQRFGDRLRDRGQQLGRDAQQFGRDVQQFGRDAGQQARTFTRDALGIEARSAEEGVQLTTIQQGTLAAEAGLRSGDRIVAIDGQQVTSQQQLDQILRTSSGEVALQIQRDGEEETVYLDVDQAQQRYAQQQQQWQQQQGQWEQQQYQQQQRAALGVTLGETRDGLIVTSVRQQSPAEQAGLQPGDLLLTLDGQQLQATQQLIQSIAQLQPGDEIEIQAARQGQQFTTVARLQPWQQAFAGPPIRTQMRFREPRMAMRPDFDRPQQDMQGTVQSLQQEVQQLRQDVQQLQQHVQQLNGGQPGRPGQQGQAPQPPQP